MNQNIRSNEVLLSMAVAGILFGAFGTGCSTKEGAQTPATALQKPANPAAAALDKHACKGFNACKGQGGCKSGDAGCAGKNSCKGKGGCSVPIEH